MNVSIVKTSVQQKIKKIKSNHNTTCRKCLQGNSKVDQIVHMWWTKGFQCGTVCVHGENMSSSGFLFLYTHIITVLQHWSNGLCILHDKEKANFIRCDLFL